MFVHLSLHMTLKRYVIFISTWKTVALECSKRLQDYSSVYQSLLVLLYLATLQQAKTNVTEGERLSWYLV